MINVYYLTILLTLIYKSLSITVHVIPHTHDDAGWIWTVDEYYNGETSPVVSVKQILDNMVLSLNDRKDRTFIYVEMAFFTKWYKQQTEDTKHAVKELVKEGRLEFINGGYVMHDEATTYYEHFIDQMRLGLLFLKEEFDYIPDIAWFIDPFGHSSANAYILNKMGFDKIALVRIEQQDKNLRRAQKKLEFYWKPFFEYSDAKIFTHITYDHYCPPGAMNPFRDDVRLNSTFIRQQAEEIYENLNEWNSGYKHDHLMLMFGCDFTFNKRGVNYENLEELMEYFKINYPDMNMIYSTPSKYFKTIFEEVKTWPSYENQDFFPYAENPYSYWTGYFSSRPYLKGTVREAGNYLKTSSRFLIEYMLSEIDINEANNINKIFSARENLAICQHHDAVAGTAREAVSQDYIKRLKDSINLLKTVQEDTFNKFIDMKVKVESCVMPVTNSDCFEIIQSDRDSYITFYNPGLSGEYLITLDTKFSDSKVYYDNGDKIVSDTICLDLNGYIDRCRLSFYLNFENGEMFKTIFIVNSYDKFLNNNKVEKLEKFNVIIREKDLSVTFNLDNLNYEVITKNQNYTFSIFNSYYEASSQNNSFIRPENTNPDGAYVLATRTLYPEKYDLIKEASTVYYGNNFSLITLRFKNSTIISRIVTKPFLHIELETIWDPIEHINPGKEFLLHITSNIKNNVLLPNNQTLPEFWTDSNGMKLMRRFKDFRQTYNYEVAEKVAANFYPVNYAISIKDRSDYLYNESDYNDKDSNIMMTVFTDRSESVGVMNEGEFMFILNRYSMYDDWKGLFEELFETSSSGYFRVRHWLALGNEFDKNYMRNVIHNRPALFKFKTNKNFSETLFKIDFYRLLIRHERKSVLKEFVFASDNIILNFYILNDKEFFIQAVNSLDRYFIKYDRDTVSFASGINVEEYNIAGTKLLRLVPDKEEIEIRPQDVRLFKIII